jgi:hypothetical protein
VVIAYCASEFIEALNIEWMQSARPRSVRHEAVVDRDDAHWIHDAASVEELRTDAGLFSRTDSLCFSFAGAAGGELAHREDVASDPN